MKLIEILQKSISSKTKAKASTTVIFGDSIVKNVYDNIITKSVKYKKHVVVKHFSGAKLNHTKHVKPTQEKQPAQIVIHVGTSDLPHNKNSNKIANKIAELAISVKTCENNVVVSGIVSRKNRFNNKVKVVNENLKDKCEEHNLQLVQRHNINLFRPTNAKGLHLNNYGDKHLTRNLTSFIENG